MATRWATKVGSEKNAKQLFKRGRRATYAAHRNLWDQGVRDQTGRSGDADPDGLRSTSVVVSTARHFMSAEKKLIATKKKVKCQQIPIVYDTCRHSLSHFVSAATVFPADLTRCAIRFKPAKRTQASYLRSVSDFLGQPGQPCHTPSSSSCARPAPSPGIPFAAAARSHS